MRYYSSEFRRLAVQLSDDIGSRDAARWLGLSYNTLSAWRKLRSALDRLLELRDKDN